MPRQEPRTVITNRGPSLSVNQPMITAKPACTRNEREYASEASALDQPNSAMSGFKKTLNEGVKAPHPMNHMMNPAAVMT